jgi:uncharacterized protein (DUF1800 family)
MLSEEFHAASSVRTIVKNPVDFCVVALRQLGVGSMMERVIREAGPEGRVPVTALGPAFNVQQSLKNMGMSLLYPPDVDGWEGGQAWITTATMVERMKFSEKVLARATMPNLFDDLTPKGVVTKLVSVLDAPLKPAKIEALVKAAEKESGGVVTRRNVPKTAVAVCRLIFASPEFQFA